MTTESGKCRHFGQTSLTGRNILLFQGPNAEYSVSGVLCLQWGGVGHSGHLLCHQARKSPGQTGIFRGRGHSPGELAEEVNEEFELSLAPRCVSMPS